MGRTTIDVLQLNSGERKMVDTRFEIGNALEDLIEDILDKYGVYKKNPTVRNRNKLTNSLNKMLQQCQPESEYAALCATVLHSSDDYRQIKIGLKSDGLWSLEMERMDMVSSGICLFK